MKTFILIMALATLSHAKSISKRGTQNCWGSNCKQKNAGGSQRIQNLYGSNGGQINGNGASGTQNCVNGNFGQLNAVGAQGHKL